MAADAPTKITFFEFLTPLVASGKKTITIRDVSESHYQPGTQVEVYTLESHSKVCDILILSVEPLAFDDINEFHAAQESLPLDELKHLIQQVYPDQQCLFLISFSLIDASISSNTNSTNYLVIQREFCAF